VRSDPPGDSPLSEALLVFGAWRREGSTRRYVVEHRLLALCMLYARTWTKRCLGHEQGGSWLVVNT